MTWEPKVFQVLKFRGLHKTGQTESDARSLCRLFNESNCGEASGGEGPQDLFMSSRLIISFPNQAESSA